MNDIFYLYYNFFLGIFVCQSWAALAEQVRLVLNEYPKLRLTQGRKVPSYLYWDQSSWPKSSVNFCMAISNCLTSCVGFKTGTGDQANHQMGQGQSSWILARVIRWALSQYFLLKGHLLILYWDSHQSMFTKARLRPYQRLRLIKLFIVLLGYANSNEVLPVYIGDDRTDEDAFKVSNALPCISLICLCQYFRTFRLTHCHIQNN